MTFLGQMPIPVLGTKKIPISDILAGIIHIISTEWCDQILVTRIRNRGRLFDILTNFLPNMRALNSKHFT